ncbi:hypothetical protein RND71_004153 [Anisodus tanguticus]|uniref:Bet v I/Major latex protein domain-containing protein n=1 Tax=Anisodus tanguticus TaxID=243964 RepID=A0AAE1VQP3_9SOLA|nr:hypothetical protein RND71_004153 [Anisodus tanguticus]
MTITSFADEYTSPVPLSRIFKASIVDSHNLMPKLMPQAIESIEFVERNGVAGSIKQINFPEGGNFKSIKYGIDELNEEKIVYKYTLIEGDTLVDELEKNNGEFKLKEEEIKAVKEKVLGMYKTVEAYLIQNPDAYA